MTTSLILVESNPNKTNIYRLRDFNALTPETLEIIRLITIDDDTKPVGSFKYKIHQYPSDIDIFEKIKVCCDESTAIQNIVHKLQQLVTEINDHPEVFWGDFKAGFDVRIYQDSAALTNLDQRKRHLKNIKYLLQPDEHSLLKQNLDNQDGFVELIRKLSTVRWTQIEILNGYKTLRNNMTLALKDALTQDSTVKLDLWAPIDGNYNEITNLFLLIVVDEQGTETIMNAELGDRLTTLQHDLFHYSAETSYNPLKFCKRLWSLSIFQKNKNLSQILAPLFSSGVANLNQIKSECEVLVSMTKKYELCHLPLKIITNQLYGIKNRINFIGDIAFDDRQLYQLIDTAIQATKQLDNCSIGLDNTFIENMLILIKFLTQIIDHYSDLFVQKNQLLRYVENF